MASAPMRNHPCPRARACACYTSTLEAVLDVTAPAHILPWIAVGWPQVNQPEENQLPQGSHFRAARGRL